MIYHSLRGNIFIQFLVKMGLFNLDYGNHFSIFYDYVYLNDIATMINISNEKGYRPLIGDKLDVYLVPLTIINSIPIQLLLFFLSLIFLKTTQWIFKKNKELLKFSKSVYFCVFWFFVPDLFLYGHVNLIKSRMDSDNGLMTVLWYASLCVFVVCYWEFYFFYQKCKKGKMSYKKINDGQIDYTEELLCLGLEQEQRKELGLRYLNFYWIFRFIFPLLVISSAQSKPQFTFWVTWTVFLSYSAYFGYTIIKKKYLKKSKFQRILNLSFEISFLLYCISLLILRNTNPDFMQRGLTISLMFIMLICECTKQAGICIGEIKGLKKKKNCKKKFSLIQFNSRQSNPEWFKQPEGCVRGCSSGLVFLICKIKIVKLN